MAVLTAKGISRLAIALLSRSLVLPNTVSRIPGTDFTGPGGSTISVRVRLPRTARTQATAGAAIIFDDVNEVPVDVTVAHLYNATHITDEDLALGLSDFGSQVLSPMIQSIAVGAEDQVASEMNAQTAHATIKFPLTPAPSADEDVILDLREALSNNKVPAGGRWLAVSSPIAKRLLKIEKFVKVNESGSASALRDAMLGRLYGFNIVESPALTGGTALAYHSSGFAFGNRSPVDVSSVDSAQASEEGIALRVVRAFDVDVLSEAVAVSTFAGCSAIFEDGATATDKKRWIKVGTSTV